MGNLRIHPRRLIRLVAIAAVIVAATAGTVRMARPADPPPLPPDYGLRSHEAMPADPNSFAVPSVVVEVPLPDKSGRGKPDKRRPTRSKPATRPASPANPAPGHLQSVPVSPPSPTPTPVPAPVKTAPEFGFER